MMKLGKRSWLLTVGHWPAIGSANRQRPKARGILIGLAHCSLATGSCVAQNTPPCFFGETFDGTVVPGGWDIGAQVEQYDGAGNALGTFVDAWTVNGADTANANGHFPVPYRHGAGNFIMANDDGDVCDCDMGAVALTSPVIDLSGRSGCAFECNVFLDQSFLGGEAAILGSIDGAVWQTLRMITATGHEWQPVFIDLSAFDGGDTLLLRFTWTDNGQWAAGFAVDDVCLYERVGNDIALVDAFMADMTQDPLDGGVRSQVYRALPIQQCDANTLALSAVVMNRGTATLTDASFTAEAVVDGSQVAINTSSTVPTLAPGERATIVLDLGWAPDAPGWVVFHWHAQSFGVDDFATNQDHIDSLRATDAGFMNGNHQMAVDRNGDDGSVGLPGDKFQVGSRFELEGAAQAPTGILVRYDEATQSGARVRARLMDGLFNELAASDVMEVSDADLATSWWTGDLVFIPFNTPVDPVSGDVFALLETTPDSGTVRISTSGSSAYGHAVMLNGIGESVAWIRRTPIVRLAFSGQEVSVQERALEQALRIWPNPASETISLMGPPSPFTFTIHDMNGREVLTRRSSGGSMVLAIAGLPNGAYTVRLVTPAGASAACLIIAR